MLAACGLCTVNLGWRTLEDSSDGYEAEITDAGKEVADNMVELVANP